MAQPKNELAVGEKGYIPPNHVWVHQPGNTVHVNRRFFAEESDAGDDKAVMVERTSPNEYRITLAAGFRAERYSGSENHTSQLLPIAHIVDEKGGTHTTMPSKYLVL